jgi:ribosome-binding factor A
MSERRVSRVAELLQQTISKIFLRLKEPLPGIITINAVKVSADFTYADVYYSALGLTAAETELEEKIKVLTPYVRQQVARILNMRRTPEFRFHYDHTAEKAARVFAILERLKREKATDEHLREKDSDQNKKDNPQE